MTKDLKRCSDRAESSLPVQTWPSGLSCRRASGRKIRRFHHGSGCASYALNFLCPNLPTPSRRQQMEQALQNLPDPIEARFREKFQQIRAAGDPVRKQMDAARDEALRLLSTEPFDEAAYDQQVKKIDELREEMFKRMGQVIKQTVKELSPDERRMFADLLRRPPPPPGQN